MFLEQTFTANLIRRTTEISLFCLMGSLAAFLAFGL